MSSDSKGSPPNPKESRSDPQTPILSVEADNNYVQPRSNVNMLRSPSRESVGTDISLLSISTLASELTVRTKLLSVRGAESAVVVSRGPSPNFFDSIRSRKPENIQEVWFEDSSEMMRGVAALSSAAGLSKSFSTTDITDAAEEFDNLKRNAVSELTFPVLGTNNNYIFQQSKLENTSRSCSTWVAVGDPPSTSQIPSPRAGCGTLPNPAFTPADFIRSVNKKVRQHYIKRRLMTTYKALERLSQSEFNLDKLEVEAAASSKVSNSGFGEQYSEDEPDRGQITRNRLSVPSAGVRLGGQKLLTAAKEKLTVTDVERERGQPLSKYDRNMMIFNWLLTLEPDQTTTDSF